jgi:hypothetical protein
MAAMSMTPLKPVGRRRGLQPNHFFEDRHAPEEFESGTFEFRAAASAVAITAAAGASAGSSGERIAEFGAATSAFRRAPCRCGWGKGPLSFYLIRSRQAAVRVA